MKNWTYKVLEFIKGIWVLIIPVFSAYLGLKAMSMFNVFEYLNIIKDSDQAFDVGVTAYFAVTDIVLVKLTTYIDKRFFAEQTMNIIFSCQGTTTSLDNTPVILLSHGHVAEAGITIEIDASRKTCRNLIVKIPNINFASMQPPKLCKEISMDSEGNYIISIEKILGQQEHVNTKQTFKILFIKEPVSGTSVCELRPELSKHPFRLTVNYNKMDIRAEEENGYDKMAG